MYLDEDKLAQIAKLLEDPSKDPSLPYLLHVELVTSYNLSVHKDDLPTWLTIYTNFVSSVKNTNDEILEIDNLVVLGNLIQLTLTNLSYTSYSTS